MSRKHCGEAMKEFLVLLKENENNNALKNELDTLRWDQGEVRKLEEDKWDDDKEENTMTATRIRRRERERDCDRNQEAKKGQARVQDPKVAKKN